MDIGSIVSVIGNVIKTAVDLTPGVIKTVEDAAPFAELIWDHLVNKKVITQSDLNDLDAKLAALSARIQAELPPEQADDI